MARDQVFISYSHADSKWLNRLEIMLAPLQRQGTLDLWADTRIQPGQRWKDEIQKALARAKVAVLLVSPDFLASRFIHENELPPLLEAACNEGLTILWIPVRHSLYRVSPLAHYQAAYDPRTPLSTLTPAQQDAALVRIAEALMAIPTPVAALPASPAPASVRTRQGIDPSVSQATPAPHKGSKPSPEPVLLTGLESKFVTPSARLSLPAIQTIHGWSTQQVQDLQRQTAVALGLKVEFRDALTDGSPGPRMMVIPGGRFLMGSPPDEPGRNSDERQHEVEVAPFAIGKYAVTFEDYDRFADATRRDKPADAGWGRGRRPVINVSWLDAVAYAEWLSQQTDRCYRLPTEAEWEYACRAGTTTAYHFGVSVTTDLANYSGGSFFKSLVANFGGNKTVEVGRYGANAWSLHDMHGNVWEWTCSAYDEDYGGAELRCVSDPQFDGRLVLRGGSWHGVPGWLRGAARTWINPHDGGSNYLGFRLARSFSSTL